MIRRSRGYAPLPVLTSNGWKGKVLAIGGELKNTFCVAVNDLFYLSPYVGDLADLRTVEALEETVERFETLLEAEPEAVVCDLHPRYNSTLVARELGLRVMEVQHHYAHVLSCMAENDYAAPVIGVSFDGTGYGTDGTIWGGELLLCDYGGFQRAGSIRPFLQLGGDASAREGWRIAVSLLYGLTRNRERTAALAEQLELCDAQTCAFQMTMYERGINGVRSTSAGRLFDAVSALLGVRRSSTFEGEAATALQFAAQRWTGEEHSFAADLAIREEEGRLILPTDELVERLLEALLAGECRERLAYLFHLGLAELIVSACIELRRRTGRGTVVLTGGCCQNTLLLGLTMDRLEGLGFRVLRHHLVPPNDGGLALGQAAAALYRLKEMNG
jgi:hydrogenase maturation protein HypF